MWDGIDYLIVDEISTVGTQFLKIINEALCATKGNGLPFGNINIIFVGDFTQLPPIGQRSLMT